MQSHLYVALVTLVALLVYIWMAFRVAGARRKAGISPPAMTGDPILERNIRVQANTGEWLPVFLASMWLFALYWNDAFAAAMGVVWIVGRILYATGYVADPAKRAMGFGIQFLAVAVLLLGGLGRVVWALAMVGA